MSVFKRFAIFGLFVTGAIFVLWYTGLANQMLHWVKTNREALLYFIEQRYGAAVLLYLGVYTVLIACSLPVASVMNITAGALFGTVLGSLYATIGATIGATIAFWIVRAFLGSMLQRHYAPQLRSFNATMAREGTRYLVTVHFIALIPFFLVTMLIGLTTVSTWTFIWTTAVGIIPSVVICAFAGQQLTTIEQVSDVFSSNVVLSLVLLALFAVLPPLANKLRKKETNRLSKRRLTLFVIGVVAVMLIIMRLLLDAGGVQYWQ